MKFVISFLILFRIAAVAKAQSAGNSKVKSVEKVGPIKDKLDHNSESKAKLGGLLNKLTGMKDKKLFKVVGEYYISSKELHGKRVLMSFFCL